GGGGRPGVAAAVHVLEEGELQRGFTGGVGGDRGAAAPLVAPVDDVDLGAGDDHTAAVGEVAAGGGLGGGVCAVDGQLLGVAGGLGRLGAGRGGGEEGGGGEGGRGGGDTAGGRG